jgi:hypothetical protein
VDEWHISTTKIYIEILRNTKTQRNGSRIVHNCCQQKIIFSFEKYQKWQTCVRSGSHLFEPHNFSEVDLIAE